MKTLLVLAVVILVASAPAFAANVLTNGDFESGATGWTDWNNGAGNKTQVVKGSDTYNGGSAPHGGSMAWACYCKSNYSGGIYQQVTVTPGSTYTLDGFWKAVSDNAPPMWYEVGLINGVWDKTIADNSTASTIWKRTDQTFPSPNTNPAAYVQLSTEAFLAGGLGTNTVVASGTTLTVWIKCGSGNANGKTRMRVDDLSLNEVVVPEPASILAMFTGLVGLGGLVRRRS